MDNRIPMMQTLTPGQQRQARFAGIIGNVVEWYDFALYGFLAVVIGRLFFPADNPTVSLLASYGVFAAGFVMRPLGAAAFGWIGDTIGRGKTMQISVAMMAFPTIALGLLPDYQTIGIAAPILLIVIRLIQGLSVGGEFSSSVTYLVETAPIGARGRAGSWANVGSMSGMLLGSAAAATVTTIFSTEALESWGWRLPFLVGGLLGLSAILLRRHLPKSPHFQEHEKNTPSQSPFRQVWFQNRAQLFQAFAFAAGYGMVFNIIVVYLPGWLARSAGVEDGLSLRVNSILTLAIIPAMVFFAWIGDTRIRRTKLVAFAMLVLGLLALPLFEFMSSGNLTTIVVGQVILFALLSVALGSAPATFVELFPSNDRLTGYSISFNLGMGVFGGATPALATWLIGLTGSELIPAVLTVIAALVAAASLFLMTDRSRAPLR